MPCQVQEDAPVRLLLVEDNPGDADLVREGLADLLEYNYDLTHVTSLHDATEAIRTGQVDVTILDLNLPDSVGIETLRRLRKVHGDVPIVLLSGQDSGEMHSIALREGAQDFIGKNEPVPFVLARSILYAREKRWAEAHQRQIQQLVDANPDAVILTDQEGLVHYVNQAAADLFEKSREAFLGHPADFPLKDDDVAESRIETSDGPHFIETRVAHVEWMGKPALLASIRDVTAQKRLREQLRQAQKMEAIGQLAGGIAHDFNNILMAIAGNLRLAQAADNDPQRLKECLSEIGRGADRATAIVKQILTFSQQRDTTFIPLALESVVREIVRFLKVTLPANITIETKLESDVPPVLADATQVHRVLMNLGMNSAHAMQTQGGILTIAMGKDNLGEQSDRAAEVPPGNYVIVTVSDTGHGMDARTMEKIFEPFFTTKEKGEGTGLGLSAVHGIMKSHRGAITVRSSPGRGSVFRLYFPVSEHPVEAHVKDIPLVKSSAGARVLYIDDEGSLVKLARIALPKFGYHISAFTDPLEALQTFQLNPDAFDAVVSDMSMPGMSGPQLAREILSVRRDLPVLLLSGFIRDRDKWVADELGIKRILLKPLMPEEIHAALQNYLS